MNNGNAIVDDSNTDIKHSRNYGGIVYTGPCRIDILNGNAPGALRWLAKATGSILMPSGKSKHHRTVLSGNALPPPRIFVCARFKSGKPTRRSQLDKLILKKSRRQ